MPAGTDEASKAPSGGERAAKRDTKGIRTSLQEAVRRAATGKDGDQSPIFIVVGPEVGPPGHKYDRDITFVPTQINLREGKYNSKGTPDSVQWQLAGTGKFTLKFKGDSPFREGGTFDQDNAVGTVKDGSPETSYHYVLTALELNGKPIHLGPGHCPEIIIQR